MENITNATLAQDNNGVHLLMEVNHFEHKETQYKPLMVYMNSTEGYAAMFQRVPSYFGDRCQFSGGACNVVVVDEYDDIVYFYSRILGTRWCGKKIRSNCTTHGMLLERLKVSN